MQWKCIVVETTLTRNRMYHQKKVSLSYAEMTQSFTENKRKDAKALSTFETLSV